MISPKESTIQRQLKLDAKMRAKHFAHFEKFSKRTHLNLHGQNITPDIVSFLCEYLKEHPKIKSLDLSKNRIGAAGAIALSANQTLTSLDVSRNEIGDAGVIALATNPTLTSLAASWNHIDRPGARALSANRTLTSLNVCGNQIMDAGAVALATNQMLTSLDVGCNRIGDTGAIVLAANQTLTSLKVNRNHIGDRGAIALIANQTLTSLNVSNNNIGSANMAILAELPERNYQRQYTQAVGELLTEKLELVDLTNLAQEYTADEFPNKNIFFTVKQETKTTQKSTARKQFELDTEVKMKHFAHFEKFSKGNRLGLHKQNITSDLIPFLCEYLKEHPEIKILDISENKIGTAGAIALAANQTLTSLNVVRNGIGAVGATALATMQLTNFKVGGNVIGAAGAIPLAANKTLTSLDVSHNGIGDAGAIALAANKTLTALNMTRNGIGAVGATALATMQLTSLKLGGNVIGAAGATALAANKTLTSLDVSQNGIGDAGATALAPNQMLTNLKVNNNNIGSANTAILAELPERNFQFQYREAVGELLTEKLELVDLTNLVQEYTAGEFPNKNTFFSSKQKHARYIDEVEHVAEAAAIPALRWSE